MNKFLVLAGAALASVTAGAAQASITVYNSQSAFMAAISAPGVDTFNDLALVQLPTTLNRTAGSYSYTATAPGDYFYGAGSGSDGWLSTNSSLDTVTFSNFSAGVAALGGFFFESDISGAYTANPLGVTLTATDADGTVTQVILDPNTASFVGFVSTGALTSATLEANLDGTPFWPTVNNLTLGALPAAGGAVPEPASWALMIAGFGLTGATLRRRGARAAIA